MMRNAGFVVAALLFGIANGFVAPAQAGTFTDTFRVWGTSVSAPVDLDGSGTGACTTINGIEWCPSDSYVYTFSGKSTGGPTWQQGLFGGQTIGENVFVSGTGCYLDPTHIQGCTVGTVTDGCLMESVGETGVNINRQTGSMLFDKSTSEQTCFDFDSGLPEEFQGTATFQITGGNGRFAGASGTSSETFHGEIMRADPAGHSFSWAKGHGSSRITLP
jgi:hypothetical protein